MLFSVEVSSCREDPVRVGVWSICFCSCFWKRAELVAYLCILCWHTCIFHHIPLKLSNTSNTSTGSQGDVRLNQVSRLASLSHGYYWRKPGRCLQVMGAVETKIPQFGAKGCVPRDAFHGDRLKFWKPHTQYVHSAVYHGWMMLNDV
jgi:hypothetical protein